MSLSNEKKKKKTRTQRPASPPWTLSIFTLQKTRALRNSESGQTPHAASSVDARNRTVVTLIVDAATPAAAAASHSSTYFTS